MNNKHCLFCQQSLTLDAYTSFEKDCWYNCEPCRARFSYISDQEMDIYYFLYLHRHHQYQREYQLIFNITDGRFTLCTIGGLQDILPTILTFL